MECKNQGIALHRKQMDKYIPKMSYYLISKIQISKEFDGLVTSIVYAEQHSQDKRRNYLENLENLAQKIVGLELRTHLQAGLLQRLPV